MDGLGMRITQRDHVLESKADQGRRKSKEPKYLMLILPRNHQHCSDHCPHPGMSLDLDDGPSIQTCVDFSFGLDPWISTCPWFHTLSRMSSYVHMFGGG